jgi:hypothetical protein
MMSHDALIFECFVLFLISIGLFACIYHQLYRRAPSRFLIGSQIRKSQRDAFRVNTANRIARAEAAIEALDHWASELRAGANLRSLSERESYATLPSGRLTRVYHWLHPVGVTGIMRDAFSCEVRDPEGMIVVHKVIPANPVSNDFWERTLDNEQQSRREKVARLKGRMASLTAESPFVWSFWDFLYFSIITQTTVGYGDILPNATQVRMVVSTQILVGYALLVVLLNVILSR